MKYLIFNLLADGTPTSRFARELAIVMDEAGEPVRVHQLGQAMVNGQVYVLSSHFLEPRYHRLIDLMFGPICPGKEMYFFGDVKDAVNRILRKGDCAPTNYAFITLAGWDDSAQRLALARGLMNYDRVFVFSESDQDELAKLQVPSEVVGDVREYIHIEQDVEEQQDLGKLLVVIPSDSRNGDVPELVADEIYKTLPPGDAVFNVILDKEDWNMSLARNCGIRRAKEGGFDYVAFHDIDAKVPEGYWEVIKSLLATSSDNVVVPKFVGEPSGVGGTASGNIALCVDKALEINGYDENYVGGGSEDIDFLFRLTRDTIAFEVVPDCPPIIHYDHAPRPGREKWDKTNEERVRRVMDYEDLDVKSSLIGVDWKKGNE
jgi:hypothetical protein